nr:MAG TPA: hypothetical protein [Caudoviricetes sp.]
MFIQGQGSCQVAALFFIVLLSLLIKCLIAYCCPKIWG